jgi:hypothetical protein
LTLEVMCSVEECAERLRWPLTVHENATLLGAGDQLPRLHVSVLPERLIFGAFVLTGLVA